MDIMDFIRGKELIVIAIIFIIAMTLYGHNRGFVKMVVSFASIIITLIIVNMTAPSVADFINNNDTVQSYVREKAEDFIYKNTPEASYDETGDIGEAMSDGEALENSGEDSYIGSLPLPEILKNRLEENNTKDIYEILGVDKVTDYVAASLSSIIIKTVVFVLMFIIVSIALRIVAHILDIFTNLPVIHGMNQLAGAGIGFLEAIFYLWLFMLIASWVSAGDISELIFKQISESSFLNFLYNNNLIGVFIFSLMGI